MAKIGSEKTTKILMGADGNIQQVEETSSTSAIKRSEEPEFIKIYIKNLELLDNVPLKAVRLLLELTKYMVYADTKDLEGGQTITLTAAKKQKIMETLNIEKRTYEKYMKALIENNLLKKLSFNHYQVNPNIIGKGFFEYRPSYNMGGIHDLQENWDKPTPIKKEIDYTYPTVKGILEEEADLAHEAGHTVDEQHFKQEIENLNPEEYKKILQFVENTPPELLGLDDFFGF